MIDFQIVFLWAFIMACFGVCWVHFLTNTEGLLWKLPKYYKHLPSLLKQILQCEKCLAGWASLVLLLSMGYYLESLPACFVSMVFARIIALKIYNN